MPYFIPLGISALRKFDFFSIYKMTVGVSNNFAMIGISPGFEANV